MFDSPFTYCPRCRQMVLLDQTQRECAQEHGCKGTDAQCPLLECFSGIDFRCGAADEKREEECSKANDGSSGAPPSTRR